MVIKYNEVKKKHISGKIDLLEEAFYALCWSTKEQIQAITSEQVVPAMTPWSERKEEVISCCWYQNDTTGR